MQFVVRSKSPVSVTACLKDLGEFLDSVALKAGYPLGQCAQGSRTVHGKCPAGRDALFPAGGRFPTHGSQWAEADPKTLQDHRRRPNLWTDDEAPRATHHSFCHSARTALTLDLFSALWRGMFARIEHDFGRKGRVRQPHARKLPGDRCGETAFGGRRPSISERSRKSVTSWLHHRGD